MTSNISSTGTNERTFSITDARKVASKIAADLDLFRIYHGRPSAQEVTNFAEEAALLLAARYLKSIEYGFRRNGRTVIALKYIARSDGTLTADDRPGRVYIEVDVSDAVWYSYLEHSDSFFKRDQAERDRFTATLPVQRTSASAPQRGNGYWEQTRIYSSNREGVVRHVFRPL